jgi:hypothetical protein
MSEKNIVFAAKIFFASQRPIPTVALDTARHAANTSN